MYGLLLAFVAAFLFGVSAPASKLLLQFFDPLQLAGLLYLGAAGATVPVVVSQRARFERLTFDRVNGLRLAGVVVLGGMVAPISLLAAFQPRRLGQYHCS